MELRNVITFITAAELGSFSGAAEKLGYAQSTISQHMKTLVKSRLVDTRKVEKKTFYYVNIGLLTRYVDTAGKL